MPSASPSVGHVVVVGASAGGVEALIQLVEGLPADLPAPVLVVLHVAAGPSHLPAILCRAGKLPVSHATDGETLAGGKIYVAPPDRHIEVRQDRVKLNGGPRQNRVRPSADVLFRSAAEVYSTRAIGVILTGLLDDGAAGLAAIKRAGGLAVVQDPRDAQNASMPEAAIAATEVDHVVPVAQIGPLIGTLVRIPGTVSAPVGPGRSPPSDAPPVEVVVACPDCGGSLHEIAESPTPQFKCYLGHRYSSLSLLQSHGEELERAIWTAIRVIEERMHLLRSMAVSQKHAGLLSAAGAYTLRADELSTCSVRLRALLAGE